MRPRLPRATARETARVAHKLGFELRRQRGSHAIYVRSFDHARVVIPVHAQEVLKPKTLSGIIRDLKITIEEFCELL